MVNIQKSSIFLYTSNEQVKSESKNTIPLHRNPQNEIPMCKSRKDVQDLYKENYKILKNEIK